MKKILTDKRLIVVVIAVVLVLLLVDFNQRMVLLTRLRRQEKELTQKYAELESTLAAIDEEIAYANSDQAVEKWAREEAGMIQEGDLLIVLLAPSNPIPTEAPHQSVIVDEVQEWEIWHELFFGQ